MLQAISILLLHYAWPERLPNQSSNMSISSFVVGSPRTVIEAVNVQSVNHLMTMTCWKMHLQGRDIAFALL